MAFTHMDHEGHPVMVNVSGKQPTEREARAEGWVCLPKTVFDAMATRTVRKGDVLAVAEIAGIQAAKQAWSLIPLCHPLHLHEVRVRCSLDSTIQAVRVESNIRAWDVTGVEMEALTAVSVAALTVYDMCKAIDKGMEIVGIRLLYKTGGKSGTYIAATTLEPQRTLKEAPENGDAPGP